MWSMVNLEKFLIVLFLLFLPSQLAFHFWPAWSLVNGIRVDYLSPTIYLTDLIILSLFLASRLRVRIPIFIIIFSILNILVSSSPLVSLYKWLRVLEYLWLFKYLTQKHLALSPWPLALSVIWTSALAWWQFFLQGSVGGLWYWLGERPLSVSTPLIAKVTLTIHNSLPTLVMRPYATFPHPNALAGFLLVGSVILYSFYTSPLRPSPIIGEGFRGRGMGLLAVLIALLTIPITFSRTVIVLEMLILLIWLRPLLLKVFLLISSIYFLISTSGSVASIPDRLDLIRKSLFLIQKSPILGVGLGSFIPATMNYELITNNYLYQPVHNIYLLLASELGLPAAMVIGYWLLVHGKKMLRTMNYELITAVAVIVITGAADHYWLTLHQNILLLIILIAYAYSYRWGSQR